MLLERFALGKVKHPLESTISAGILCSCISWNYAEHIPWKYTEYMLTFFWNYSEYILSINSWMYAEYMLSLFLGKYTEILLSVFLGSGK